MKKALCTTVMAAVLNLNAMNLSEMNKEANASHDVRTVSPSETAYNEILAAEDDVRIKKENADNLKTKCEDMNRKISNMWAKNNEALDRCDAAQELCNDAIWQGYRISEGENQDPKLKKLYDEAKTKYDNAHKEHEEASAECDKMKTEDERSRLERAEAEEAHKKAVEAHKKLKLEGPSKVAFWEVYKMSRAFEGDAAVNLKNKLGLGDDYEIRIMDARHLIEGMKLEEKEEEILALLDVKEDKVEEKVIPHIERYLNEVCTFSDKGLEKEVRNDVLKGCRQSKIYRDTFITLIARVKMPKPFFSGRIYDLSEEGKLYSVRHAGKLNLVRGDSSASRNDEIIFCNEKGYIRSLQAKTSTGKDSGRGFLVYPVDKRNILPHEGGHSISGDFAQHASEPATMDVTSKFANFTPNKENVARNRRHIESVAALPEKRKKLLELFPKDIQDKYKDEGNPQTLAAALVDYQITHAAEWIFNNTVEIFQIMGVGVWENNGKKILCINPLSDLARSLEQGLPQKFGHEAYPSSLMLLKMLFASPTKCIQQLYWQRYNFFDLVDYSKTDAYDALCDAIRSSAEKPKDATNPNTLPTIEAHDANPNSEKSTTRCWDAIKSCWNWWFESKKVKND
ncbi:hypothetical protein FACS189449_03630 [Alphaproteobacteria bacterium]|nr:hypothetical protein FACS189449_03630 [Alphaproteobacteria bacterium]